MRLLTFLFAALAFAAPATAAELLYVHDPACGYCREWERVIGPIYPRSAEGKLAPLRPMLIRDVPAAGYRLKTVVRYTPTFVLLDGGVEVGRIEGYPGEDAFWSLLSRLLDRIDPEPAPAPTFGSGATRTSLTPGR
jgi:hypothetical protein